MKRNSPPAATSVGSLKNRTRHADDSAGGSRYRHGTNKFRRKKPARRRISEYLGEADVLSLGQDARGLTEDSCRCRGGGWYYLGGYNRSRHAHRTSTFLGVGTHFEIASAFAACSGRQALDCETEACSGS